MWKGRSLYNEQEVWYYDEVLCLVAEDPLLRLGVDGGLLGAYRTGDPRPPLGLVAPGLGEWAVGLHAPPSVVLGDL